LKGRRLTPSSGSSDEFEMRRIGGGREGEQRWKVGSNGDSGGGSESAEAAAAMNWWHGYRQFTTTKGGEQNGNNCSQ